MLVLALCLVYYFNICSRSEQNSKRNTICIGVRHNGQQLSMADTVSAQDAQKLRCPHGTGATPFRALLLQNKFLNTFDDGLKR